MDFSITLETRSGPFLGGLLVASLLLLLSPRRPNVFEVLVYVAFGILGLRMIRASIWFGLFMAPIVADHVHVISQGLGIGAVRGRKATSPRLKNVLNVAILAGLLVIGSLSTPWLKQTVPIPLLKRDLLSEVSSDN